MATSLLVGNGINRVIDKDASWECVLKALVPAGLSDQALEHMRHKPFAFVDEKILLNLICVGNLRPCGADLLRR